ncbi:MAG: D-alanyl-D-alanine carboxypeptidase family protein [Paracoccaceae bacterium]
MLFRALALLVTLFALPAYALETTARAAMVIDYDTGIVLLAKNEDEPLPPASMSKLMTLNMVFEALEDGRLTLDEVLPVSEHAMSYGGSTMFLNTRDRVSVEDLIRGVVVLSGNDASAVLAEALGGSEAEFSRRMTNRAQELGMLNSVFANSNGWPAENHRMSARDLVFLARRLIKEFPQYYGYFAETEFGFDERASQNRFNRNPLLALNIGADGLKTGHTSEAGYGLVGSAVRDGRRVVFMITGLETAAAREAEAERLINWAFREFTQRTLFNAGTRLAEAEVWLGTAPHVGLTLQEDVSLLLPFQQLNNISAHVRYTGPIAARDGARGQITMGDMLAVLEVSVPDFGDYSFPLVAMESVQPAGFVARFGAAFNQLKSQLLSAL